MNLQQQCGVKIVQGNVKYDEQAKKKVTEVEQHEERFTKIFYSQNENTGELVSHRWGWALNKV